MNFSTISSSLYHREHQHTPPAFRATGALARGVTRHAVIVPGAAAGIRLSYASVPVCPRSGCCLFSTAVSTTLLRSAPTYLHLSLLTGEHLTLGVKTSDTKQPMSALDHGDAISSSHYPWVRFFPLSYRATLSRTHSSATLMPRLVRLLELHLGIQHTSGGSV